MQRIYSLNSASVPYAATTIKICTGSLLDPSQGEYVRRIMEMDNRAQSELGTISYFVPAEQKGFRNSTNLVEVASCL
jgi:hypothetical protein